MTGFGRSQRETETGGAMPPESDPRAPHPPLAHHPPPSHHSLDMLQQLARHLPLAARQPHGPAATAVPAAHPVPASGGDHGLLQALTHSLDLAGRGYCCLANPLEETATLEATAAAEAPMDAAQVDAAQANKTEADSMDSPKQDAGGSRR